MSYMNEDWDEVMLDFIDADFSSEAAEQVLDKIAYGAYNEMYAPSSAARLVLVHSESDYAFTSDDLSWLSVAQNVLSYNLSESDDTALFFLDMACNTEDYYVCCAAVIKVFSIAFPGNNLFVFKVDNKIAIGSKRDFENSLKNNFAISGLFSERTIDEFEGFFESLEIADLYEIPSVIIQYSPQEKETERNYDKNQIDPDYISFLSEFQSVYGVDTSRERYRCLSEYTVNDLQVTDTYHSAEIELDGIADEQMTSSYEELDMAQKAEEKALSIKFLSGDGNSSIGPLEEQIPEFSEEAFMDAEQMLKEMLGKDDEDNKGEEL